LVVGNERHDELDATLAELAWPVPSTWRRFARAWWGLGDHDGEDATMPLQETL
jgi:hypothetical protein